MGKTHNSIVVVQIKPTFWEILPMGVEDVHKKMSTKLNGGGRERMLRVVSKFATRGQKMPFWGRYGCLGCPCRVPFALKTN